MAHSHLMAQIRADRPVKSGIKYGVKSVSRLTIQVAFGTVSSQAELDGIKSLSGPTDGVKSESKLTDRSYPGSLTGSNEGSNFGAVKLH